MTETEVTTSSTTADALTNRAAWLTALRSGRYRQGSAALRVDDDNGPTYCCLGVAELVRGATWNAFVPPDERDPDNDVEASGSDATHYVVPADPSGERGETVLTHAGMAWLGVLDSTPYVVVADGHDEWSVESLTTLNDQRQWSFSKIADVVEAQREDWDGTESWCEARVDELRLARDAAALGVPTGETS